MKVHLSFEDMHLKPTQIFYLWISLQVTHLLD